MKQRLRGLLAWILALSMVFSMMPTAVFADDGGEGDGGYIEDTTEPEYTEPEYTEPEWTEPEYTEPEYTEPEYTEDPPMEECYHESFWYDPIGDGRHDIYCANCGEYWGDDSCEDDGSGFCWQCGGEIWNGESEDSPEPFNRRTGLTYVSAAGFDAFAGEDAENLFDSNLSTKLCCVFEEDSSVCVVFGAENGPVSISDYILVTANDTENSPERNPKDWTLFGSNDGEQWEEIETRVGAEMPASNYTSVTFGLEAPTPAYDAFKLEISTTAGEERGSGSNEYLLQLSELDVIVHEHHLEYVEGTAATCVADGVEAHYICTDCKQTYLDSDAKVKADAEDLLLPMARNHQMVNNVCTVCGIVCDHAQYNEQENRCMNCGQQALAIHDNPRNRKPIFEADQLFTPMKNESGMWGNILLMDVNVPVEYCGQGKEVRSVELNTNGHTLCVPDGYVLDLNNVTLIGNGRESAAVRGSMHLSHDNTLTDCVIEGSVIFNSDEFDYYSASMTNCEIRGSVNVDHYDSFSVNNTAIHNGFGFDHIPTLDLTNVYAEGNMSITNCCATISGGSYSGQLNLGQVGSFESHNLRVDALNMVCVENVTAYAPEVGEPVGWEWEIVEPEVHVYGDGWTVENGTLTFEDANAIRDSLFWQAWVPVVYEFVLLDDAGWDDTIPELFKDVESWKKVRYSCVDCYDAVTDDVHFAPEHNKVQSQFGEHELEVVDNCTLCLRSFAPNSNLPVEAIYEYYRIAGVPIVGYCRSINDLLEAAGEEQDVRVYLLQDAELDSETYFPHSVQFLLEGTTLTITGDVGFEEYVDFQNGNVDVAGSLNVVGSLYMDEAYVICDSFRINGTFVMALANHALLEIREENAAAITIPTVSLDETSRIIGAGYLQPANEREMNGEDYLTCLAHYLPEGCSAVSTFGLTIPEADDPCGSGSDYDPWGSGSGYDPCGSGSDYDPCGGFDYDDVTDENGYPKDVIYFVDSNRAPIENWSLQGPATEHNYVTSKVDPTCTEPGREEETRCTICGRYDGDPGGELDPLGHDFSVFVSGDHPTCTEGAYAVMQCSRCDEITECRLPALRHSFTKQVILQEATCVENGSYQLICERCGADYEATQIVHSSNLDDAGDRINGADYDADLNERTTVTIDGAESLLLKVRYRTESGWDKLYLYDGEGSLLAELSGENEGDAEEFTVEGDTFSLLFTSDGSICDYGYHITVIGIGCSGIRETEMDPDNHVHTELRGAVEATCTEDGATGSLWCFDCERNVTESEVIPAFGHRYEEVSVENATCTEAGMKYFVCANCKNENTVVIPAAGHSWVSMENAVKPTCTEKGHESDSICTACDAVEKGAEIEVLAHTVVTDEAIPATCTAEGLTEGSHCAVCGEVITAQKPVSMVPHSWDDGVVTREPSADAEGIKTYTCTVCGEEKTEAILSLIITSQPEDVMAYVGDTVSFHVDAVSDGNATYQWYYSANGTKWYKTSASGATTDTLTVKVNSTNLGYSYRCTVKDEKFSVTSETAVLRPNPDAKILKQPVDTKASGGTTVDFTVTAANAVSYQWYYSTDGSKWYKSGAAGAATDSLAVAATAANSGRYYRCKIKAENGTEDTSEIARFLVADPVVIVKQPVNTEVISGKKAVFTVEAENVVKYQWQYSADGSKWYKSGATGAATAAVTLAGTSTNNGRYFRCVLTGEDGKTTYTDAVQLTLAVGGASITQQPVSTSGSSGQKVTFTVAAEGAKTYQWYYSADGSKWYKSGATGAATASVTIAATSANNGRYFRCVITGNDGVAVTSEAAQFTLN